MLPQKKALRANERNKEFFEKQRVQLEARNLEQKSEAEKLAEKLNGQRFVIVRSAGENGHLYGSVSIRDIIESMHEAGVKINRAQIELNQPFKNLGLHELTLNLHPEVQAKAQAELDRVIGSGRLPEPSDKASLPYIEAVIRETLRWHPVVPVGM